jgi:hypothetical protein
MPPLRQTIDREGNDQMADRIEMDLRFEGESAEEVQALLGEFGADKVQPRSERGCSCFASRLPKRWMITGRSTENPNGYCVVNGNVWPELMTVGTEMRPMVSDMKCGTGFERIR